MEIKKKFIHVGLHKTATTYLQNYIFNNIENFELVTRPYTQHNKAFNMMQYADDTMYNENLVFECRYGVIDDGDGMDDKNSIVYENSYKQNYQSV